MPCFSKTIARKAVGLPDVLLRQFKRLSFGSEGRMCSMLKDADEKSYVFYIYDSERNVASWAITGKNTFAAEFSIFTDARYRGLGLASRLVRYVAKNNARYTGRRLEYFDEGESTRFFNHCKEAGILDSRVFESWWGEEI